ncbi:2OG-Fe(II) oxygenase family protein [Shewanella sp. NIFS-20-20]|uniref:2OG-Fe(II) oxygenase family protein n=1 Tax=Shewanella sp. NIFS-20-20 TaxID=2853806 RepID=UPI001C450DD5|nr:2OG-Fe(II) oxygenase family protein [Shewanella sp. NIFS-20-20]MBV7314351.1 hypothetical protein [Shewanella sp. NIFS-20-20]
MLINLDFRAKDCAQHLCQSLQQDGLVLLHQTSLDFDLIESLYRQWRQFFNDDNKYQYLYHPQDQLGFYPLEISETAKEHCVKDIKEFFHYHPGAKTPAQLQQSSQAYFEQALSFTSQLMTMLVNDPTLHTNHPLAKLSLTKPHKQHLLRIVNYPKPDVAQEFGAYPCAPHHDINLLTITPLTSINTIEYRVNDHWQRIPYFPNTVLVAVGEMLSEMSQGLYPALFHRINQVTLPRGSSANIEMPFFFHPAPNQVLSSRATASQMLNERLHDLGVLAKQID